jgi:hypothetical protein
MHGMDEKFIHLVGYVEGNYKSEDLGGRIISKWILNRMGDYVLHSCCPG